MQRMREVKFDADGNVIHPEPPTLPYDLRDTYIQYGTDEEGVGEVRYPINWEQLYNLKGRLLTLIDATFTDLQQRKAQKDVVWQTLQGWMADIEADAGWPEPHLTTVHSDESDRIRGEGSA